MRIFIATWSMYTITVNTNQNLARRLSQQNKQLNVSWPDPTFPSHVKKS